MSRKILRRLVGVMVALCAAMSIAASFDDRILERVDGYRADDRIDIVVGFTQPLRYVSHAMGPRGEVLRVQLLNISSASSRAADSDGRSNLRWSGSRDVPLDEVLAETGGNSPSILVRFRGAVQLRSVRVDADNRTMTITIDAPKVVEPEPPEAAADVSSESAGAIYVINLASVRSAQSVTAFRPGLETDGRRVFESIAHVDGQQVYRMRLGFFTSSAEAKKVLQTVVDRYPDAWISEVSAMERDLVVAGKLQIDPSQLMVTPAADTRLPPLSLERISELMEQARQAMAQGDIGRAVLIYNRVSVYPVSPYQEDAQELLGVAHEKKGQLALARSAYQAYLERYPVGSGADRVRQRLAGLLTAAVRPRERIQPQQEEPGELSRWDVYGSFGQSYQNLFSRVNGEDLQMPQSLLLNMFDINGRRRGTGNDLRLRLTGGYDQDFIDNTDSQPQLSEGYADYTSANQIHQGRVGRQTYSSGGVLGRFDGARYGYRINDDYRINLVAGAPVFSSSDGINQEQLFYGASVDVGPFWEDWSFNLFAINQEVGGLTDRTAIGGEVRYFAPGRSLFGLLDYDVYFNDLNILYSVGSWSVNDRTTLSMVLDYRKTPLLSTSNALLGQLVLSIDDLRPSYSEQAIKQLAIDRTATSKSAAFGASYLLDSHWQVAGDLSVITLSSTPASGGVEATPSAGPDYYYNLQFIGTDLFKDGDLAITGLRFSDTTSAQTITTSFNLRYPVNSSWRINPRLELDYRWNNGGGNQWVVAPALRATYVWKRVLSIELEGGAEVAEVQQAGNRDLTELYYFYVGYRYDF